MPKRHASEVRYPGGLVAEYAWTGPSHTARHTCAQPERLCGAELSLSGPAGAWSAAFDSPIFDEPEGFFWDATGLLLVKFGFSVHALQARTGEVGWVHRSPTPVLSVMGSVRLPHVLIQSELETVALQEDGSPVWRVAHSDVVTEATLIGRRLVLTGYAGPFPPMDPLSGRELR